MTFVVALVPPDHVEEAWPIALPFMERAAEYTYGRYTADDILDSVTQYDHQLWLTFREGGDAKGAAVTTIKQYPRKRFLDLTFIGGDDGMAWKNEMLDVLRRWARDNHCDGIESSGRLGWARIFKSDGYAPLWQTFELPIVVGMEN